MTFPAARGATRTLAALAGTITLAMLVGCGASSTGSTGTDASTGASTASAGSGYPVSVMNCGRTLTFDYEPKRVVSLWQAPTEMMLALGLQDRIVGMAGNYTDLPADLAPAAKGIKTIGTSMSWPSKEVLLSQAPDLVLGQVLDGFAFDTSQGYASVKQIEAGGSQVYGANSCTTAGNLKMSVDTPEETLRDLGEIFNVRDRAAKLIAQLDAQKQLVVEAVKGMPTVRVAYYNGGTGPLIVLAGGIYDDAIATAGGKNVFPADSQYVSKEAFATSAPDVILVGTFQGQNFAAERDYLQKTFPNLPAVKNGRIAEVPVDDTDASVTVMTGLAKIAVAVHPEAHITVPQR